jgi:hypothetical protein
MKMSQLLHFKMAYLTLFNTLSILSLLATFSGAQQPTLKLKDATYVGTTTRISSATNTVNQFFGVQYATPSERFGPPQALPDGSTIKNATQQPPVCIQQQRKVI